MLAKNPGEKAFVKFLSVPVNAASLERTTRPAM